MCFPPALSHVLPVLTFLPATSCPAIARIAVVPYFFIIHGAVGQSARALHLPIGSYFHADHVDKYIKVPSYTLCQVFWSCLKSRIFCDDLAKYIKRWEVLNVVASLPCFQMLGLCLPKYHIC